MKKPAVFLFLFMVLQLSSYSFGQRQSGRVYEFLGLPGTARITALGGYAIPDLDNDLGMALTYPALLNKEMSYHLSLNFVDYFDDINYGTVSLARDFQNAGTFSLAMQYIDYGSFTEADETGETYGEFTAGEYNFMIGWGMMLNEQFSIGSNIKAIHSTLHEYQSFGLAVDVSVAYRNPERLLAIGLAARNMGRQLTYYHTANREPLPFDLVVGISKELANAPFRFSATAHNLHNFDLTYESGQLAPQQISGFSPQEDDDRDKMADISDQLMRHLVFGVEFIPTDNFNFRLGYNYRRRQEMKIESKISTVGFSWGFGVRISRFQLDYGRSNYHLAGAPNHISISTSLSDLFYRPENNTPLIRESQ